MRTCETPQIVIARLHKEVAAAVRNPEVAKRLSDLAADGIGSTPQQHEAMLRRQMEQFRQVIKEMKLD
ncbi:MAG: tripartite tricarboxylate transporter substrate-binding protein [Pseudomonadota bacterium]